MKRLKRSSVFLLGICLLAAVTTPSADAVYNYRHGFSIPLYTGSESGEMAWDEQLASQVGSDTIRITLSWDGYQTGVNQYNQSALDNIVYRVQAARKASPNPFYPRALISFELPAEPVPWMQAAGYGLKNVASEAQYRRYYPTTKAGAEAYGRAMAKALKYLYSVQIADFIETPNEPNLTNGPSDPVPPEQIGTLAAYGIYWAAVEGMNLSTETAPAFLVGAVSAGQSDNLAEVKEHSYGNKSPAEYYFDVQWWTNYILHQATSQADADWLNKTWRASFHAYPRLGRAEEWSCQEIVTKNKQGIWEYYRQDERGDQTGETANVTVEERLLPLLEKLNENRKWWVTETGMTSYKYDPPGIESWEHCEQRRAEGGGSYGKTQQKEFYAKFGWFQEYLRTHPPAGQPWWARFEGVTFFLGHDTPDRESGLPITHPAPPWAGFGAYWGFTDEIYSSFKNWSCAGMYCPKPAATYFQNNY